jgi:hypothetical protein
MGGTRSNLRPKLFPLTAASEVRLNVMLAPAYPNMAVARIAFLATGFICLSLC